MYTPYLNNNIQCNRVRQFSQFLLILGSWYWQVKVEPKWPKMEHFSKFSNPLFWLNYVPMCQCTKSLLIFFWICNCPKMAPKGAFFEIFKPIIRAQLCVYSRLCNKRTSRINVPWAIFGFKVQFSSKINVPLVQNHSTQKFAKKSLINVPQYVPLNL